MVKISRLYLRKPAYFFLLDKSELWKRGNWCTNWQNESTSLYFYLKSHIFELLQHTMEKNSTSRSGTTSNLYCLFGVTVIKLCQCWVPSQVDVTLRYSILLLPPFATSFLSYNSHRKHFLSCGFSLVFFFFFALCKRFWFGQFVTLERLNKSWL